MRGSSVQVVMRGFSSFGGYAGMRGNHVVALESPKNVGGLAPALPPALRPPSGLLLFRRSKGCLRQNDKPLTIKGCRAGKI